MQVKRKFNYKILAVFVAVLVAVCSLFAFLPFGKKVNSVSAAVAAPFTNITQENKDQFGFSTYTAQGGYRSINVNPLLDVQYSFSDSTTSNVYSLDIDNYIWTNHGFSLTNVVTYNNSNVNFNDVAWTYVSMHWANLPDFLDFGKFDLYISDPTMVSEIQFYDYNGVAASGRFEEVILPLPLTRYYKIVPSYQLSDPSRAQKIRSAVFVINGSIMRDYTDFYYSTGSYVSVFVLPKGYIANSTDAYNQGYSVGYEVGLQNGDERSYQVGYSEGYNVGYSKGSSAASSSSLFNNLFTAAIDVPVKSILGLLDFEVFGVDMSTFVLSLFSIALVLSIVRRFL